MCFCRRLPSPGTWYLSHPFCFVQPITVQDFDSSESIDIFHVLRGTSVTPLVLVMCRRRSFHVRMGVSRRSMSMDVVVVHHIRCLFYRSSNEELK
jgi:hypothetical protein